MNSTSSHFMNDTTQWYQNLTNSQKYWVRNITPECLKNAVVIDFEGPKTGPPELVGVMHNGQFQTIFFSNVFESCVPYYMNSKVQPFNEFVGWINTLIAEGSKVIAFSTLEGYYLLPNVLNDNISFWYRDAHKYFKNHSSLWNGIRKPRPFDLSAVLKRLNIPERQYGFQQASQRIKFVKRHLEAGKNFDNLTPTAKAKMTKVLRYNEDDVRCLISAIEASFEY